MGINYTQGQPRVIGERDKQFYLDNGFFIAKGLFNPEECDEILSRLQLYQNANGAAMLNPDREYKLSQYAQEKIAEERGIPFEEVPLEDIPFGRNIETSMLLRRFIKDPRAVSVIRQLHEGVYEERAGRKPLNWGYLMSQIIFKTAGTQYQAQAWNPHQDNSYVGNRNGLYFTTNVFFADADLENGTMYFHPGTHKEGLLPCEEVKSFREEKGKNPGNATIIPEGYPKVDMDFAKGDMLFMNGDLVHGSYPNTSKTRSRPLYSVSYIPEGEHFKPGRGSEKMFIPL